MTSRLRLRVTAARPALAAVFLVALLMAVGACSSSGSDSSTPATAAASTEASGATCGVHEIDGVQVRTFCGTGTAKVAGGTVTLSLAKASCESSASYVAVNAGTVVLGADDAAKKVRATTQYIGLVVGQVDADSTNAPASKDGIYTGALLTVNDKGTALLSDATSLKVILVSNRTAGTFSGKLINGSSVVGTFKCG